MKKLILLFVALVVQVCASDPKVLMVSGLGMEPVNITYETGETVSQVCEKVFALNPDIHPRLIKLVVDTRPLDPSSSEIFPNDVTSISLVKLVRDCMVEVRPDSTYPTTQKEITITSDRFPEVTIFVRDSALRFDDQPPKEDLLHRIINHLNPNVLSLKVFSENLFTLAVYYKSENDNCLYYGLAFLKWLKETSEFGVHMRDLDADTFRKFQKNTGGLFSALRYDGHHQLDKLRAEVQSLALKDFPESSEPLTLREGNAGYDGYEIDNILRELKLPPEATPTP